MYRSSILSNLVYKLILKISITKFIGYLIWPVLTKTLTNYVLVCIWYGELVHKQGFQISNSNVYRIGYLVFKSKDCRIETTIFCLHLLISVVIYLMFNIYEWVANLKAISTYQKENTISVYILYSIWMCKYKSRWYKI